jgi:hypothetical protein
MDSRVALALPRRVSTPAEREKWHQVLEAGWYPRLDLATDDAALGPRTALSRWLVYQPRDIAAVARKRMLRCQRAIDVDVRAKALFRVLRTCHHNSGSPGRSVAAHPRVVRGPNSRRPIRFPVSPAGLVHT